MHAGSPFTILRDAKDAPLAGIAGELKRGLWQEKIEEKLEAQLTADKITDKALEKQTELEDGPERRNQ